ncbi:hypothetical protein BDW74DRAFT_175200 [Aspergillus multicolor]|uniref:uncharacterized protein n=1 Tax=Aspergillus multicolor TaxID=41759 RepID=UPI003CCD712F
MSTETKPSSPQADRITVPILLKALRRYSKTSPETIEGLLAACIANNMPMLRALFEQWSLNDYDINELGDVIQEAMCRNNVEIVSMFLSKGQTLGTTYALNAVRYKATDALDLFLQNGWEINDGFAQARPPVLGYAVHDEDMVTWLFEHGAHPNQQSLIDLTPTLIAV